MRFRAYKIMRRRDAPNSSLISYITLKNLDAKADAEAPKVILKNAFNINSFTCYE